MRPWLVVAGDFAIHGGMDMANYGLARYLATRGDGDVHLVAHAVAPELASRPGVHVHRAWRPFGKHRLGEPALRITARRWLEKLSGDGVRAIANGGNVDAADVCWVHFVHAAFEPRAAASKRARPAAANHRRYLREERQALLRARLVLCNSKRTADDVATLGVRRDRTRIVYYGVEAGRFGPIDACEREAARRALGLAPHAYVVLFTGALGDRRKNLDTTFDAWQRLCDRPDWSDAELLVAGTGRELEFWRQRADEELPGQVRFLGFRRDVPALLAAADLLVHPARYEAYGLAVHEAICRGVPALVSAYAGVAERYPAELKGLLVEEPESAAELADRIAACRGDARLRERVRRFAGDLRSRTWDHMARDIVDAVESGGRT